MPPISRADLPQVFSAIRELYREVEQNSPRCEAARTVLLDRMTPPFQHTKLECPELSDSQLDLEHKAALLDLRDRLLLAHFYEAPGVRGPDVQLMVFLRSVLNRLGSELYSGDREPIGSRSGDQASTSPADGDARGRTLPAKECAGKINDIIKFVLRCGKSDSIASRPIPQDRFIKLQELETEVFQLCHRYGLVSELPKSAPPEGFSSTAKLRIAWRPATSADLEGEDKCLGPLLPDRGGNFHGVVLAKTTEWLDEMMRLREFVRDVDVSAIEIAATDEWKVEADLGWAPREDSAAKPKRPKGPPRRHDEEKDKRLLKDWQAAKHSGNDMKSFAEARGVKARDIKAAQARERHRRKLKRSRQAK
jgi:hypothetical protein